VLAEFSGRAKDSGSPIRQRFGVINSDLREDGKVGQARFFLDWQEAREAAGLRARRNRNSGAACKERPSRLPVNAMRRAVGYSAAPPGAMSTAPGLSGRK
jgi:hypothetical protein